MSPNRDNTTWYWITSNFIMELYMLKKPSIHMHFGGAHDDITVDGVTFERGKLTKHDFGFLRNVVIDALLKVGSLTRRGAVA